MLAKRVIPCLDVHDGAVTRGVQFGRAEEGGLRNVGDPVELAVRYDKQGADEMVFFDITASAHGRDTMVDVMGRVASRCFMPLTVGGGIRTVEDMGIMLKAGADKISINSAALSKPELIREGQKSLAASALSSRSTQRKLVVANGGSFHTAGVRKPAWTRSSGQFVLLNSALARSF